ncbi:MAG: hypothetical protein ACLRX5_09465 [Slackia sp.]
MLAGRRTLPRPGWCGCSAGKVVIPRSGARYAVVQPPGHTNGWNYDKIAPASGRELPEGEPAIDGGLCPASAPSAADSANPENP